MSTIRVAQIGTGHAHAAGKMKALRESSEFEVVGVCESDARRRAMLADDPVYEGVAWRTQDDLLADKSIQAIAVETQVPDLLATAAACIAAGKHIHLDKPAGFSLTEFTNILERAASQHLVVQMGYMYRTHPGVKLLDELLQQGVLGEIYSVQAVIGKLLSQTSRQGLLAQPGGIMFELGGHMLDLVIHLLGKPEETFTVNQHSSSIDDGYLDNMLAVLKYPRAHATIHSSVNDVDGFARRQLIVCGTQGTLEIRPMPSPAARLTLTSAYGRFRKGWQEVTLPKYVRYVEDITEFARMIRHEQDPRYSYEHDLIVQETLLQISGLPAD